MTLIYLTLKHQKGYLLGIPFEKRYNFPLHKKKLLKTPYFDFLNFSEQVLLGKLTKKKTANRFLPDFAKEILGWQTFRRSNVKRLNGATWTASIVYFFPLQRPY